MALTKLQKLAGVSAVALGVAIAASDGWSASYTAGSGNAFTVPVTATVSNTINVTNTTALAIGTIGVSGDATDTATLVLAANGTITDDSAGPARIIAQAATGQQGVIDITGGFANTDLNVDMGNPVNLNCGACTGTQPDFALTDAVTSLATPGNLSGPTTAQGTFSGTGTLSFNYGVTITTIASANAYEDGSYAGSFDFFFAY